MSATNVSPIIAPPTLEQLLVRRVELKRAADAAAALVKAVDVQIIDNAMRPISGEGSVTEKAGDYKVTVSFGVTRSVDTEAVRAAWAILPKAVADCFKWKADVTLPALRALGVEDAATIATFITAKPSSPSIKVDLA